MQSTLSILSLEQGKLTPKGETEAAYFARFTPRQPRFAAMSIFTTLRWSRLMARKADAAPAAGRAQNAAPFQFTGS